MQFVSRLPGFHIFASNKDTKKKLKGWVADSFWKNIKITYTCVDPPQIVAASKAKFDKMAAMAQLGIPKEKFVVLCVGQFVDRKGRWIFLDAAKKVSDSSSDAVFVWVTTSLPDAEDSRRIDEYGLGEIFNLVLSNTIGRTRPEILKFFRLADAFAL